MGTILGAVLTLMSALWNQTSAQMKPHVLIALAHITALVHLDTVRTSDFVLTLMNVFLA